MALPEWTVPSLWHVVARSLTIIQSRAPAVYSPRENRDAIAVRIRALGGLLLLSAGMAYMPSKWVGATLAALAFGTVALVQPFVGLVGVALALPFGMLYPVPVPGANAVDLLVGFAFVTWALARLSARRLAIRAVPGMWPLLGFLWFAGLSLLAAASWREGTSEWLKWAEFTMVYVVASQVLGPRRTWWVVGALFWAGMVEVAIGAYQFTRQVGPEAFAIGGRFLRAYGTFGQPNPYAGYLGYLAPVALSLSLAGFGHWWRCHRPLTAVMACLTSAVAGLLILGIGMSWSRGAWVALAAAVVPIIVLRSRRQMAAALLIVGVATALLVAGGGASWVPPGVAARVSDLGVYVLGPDPATTEITDANFAVLERLAHWQAGLRMFQDHPWIGVGIGNYAAAYSAYALPHWYEALGHAHNVWINLLAETGILGFGAFALFWLSLFRYALRAAQDPAASAYRRALAIGLVGSLTYLTVHGLFDNLFVQHLQLQLALLAGGLVACSHEERKPAAASTPSQEQPFARQPAELLSSRGVS